MNQTAAREGNVVVLGGEQEGKVCYYYVREKV